MAQSTEVQIDSKELEAIQKLGGLNARYEKFLKNGVVTITSQAQADEAGALVNDLSQGETFIDGLWREETDIAYKLWNSLTNKIKKYVGPTTGKIFNLKSGIKLFLLKQTAVVEKKEEKANAVLAQQGVTDFSYQMDRPMAAGFNKPTAKYPVKCVDMVALAKAVGSKKAPAAILTFAPKSNFTEIDYINAKVVDGKRYVYPGVVIEKDLQLTRSSR